jgi:hypothetical protein
VIELDPNQTNSDKRHKPSAEVSINYTHVCLDAHPVRLVLFSVMASPASTRNMRQASSSGYSDATFLNTLSVLSQTSTVTGTDGLPPSMLPADPTGQPAKNWVPVPGAPWVDPKLPRPSARPRTLVLCFDGTGDQFDDDVCYGLCCTSEKIGFGFTRLLEL